MPEIGRTGGALAALLLPLLTAPAPGAATGGIDDTFECLALTLYFEAGAEGVEGMEAVAAVVMNRVAHPEFPDEVCAVVTEGGETPPCQFSWWCDGRSDRPDEHPRYELAREVAAKWLRDPSSDPTGAALFFHAAEIGRPWEETREETARIGGHVFYR